MTLFNSFDAILEGHNTDDDDEKAIDYARGMVWSECEVHEQSIAHGLYVDTVDDIEVWYDYGADYYFFCPVDPYDNISTQ